jgi:hypothetical protein
MHVRPRSRRGILFTGVNGERVTLVACEQRTAIVWLESIDMMLATTGGGWIGSGSPGGPKSAWAMGAESKLSRTEREEIEERYVNLAAYSHNLIRAGALPGGGGASSKIWLHIHTILFGQVLFQVVVVLVRRGVSSQRINPWARVLLVGRGGYTTQSPKSVRMVRGMTMKILRVLLNVVP